MADGVTPFGLDFEATLPPYPLRIRWVLAVCLAVVCVVGLFGNGLVMISVIFSKKLQTKTNVFVFTLAIADFMTCCGMPFSSISFVHEELPFPYPVCTLGACLIWTGVGSSTINLAYIAYNRFILITRSRSAYDRIFSTLNITLMLIFAWLFPFLLYIIPVFLMLDGNGYTEYFHVCMTDAFAYLGVFFQIPSSIVIIVCYIKIFRYIRSHSVGIRSKCNVEAPSSSQSQGSAECGKNNPSNVTLISSNPPTSPRPPLKRNKSGIDRSISSRQVQVTKNMFFVVCGYYICIMPYAIVTIFTDFADERVVAVVLPWTTSFMLLNSCVNFVIYSFNHPQFNTVFRRILTCRFQDIPQPSPFLQKLLRV